MRGRASSGTRASRKEVSVEMASRRTGLAVRRIWHCIRLELVSEPLTEAVLAQLRRIRRLVELGVNMAGIEVILRMRRQIIELQDRIRRIEVREQVSVGGFVELPQEGQRGETST